MLAPERVSQAFFFHEVNFPPDDRGQRQGTVIKQGDMATANFP